MSDRPYVSFAELKEKISVPDVLGAMGLLDQFQRRGDTLTGVCPLPGHKHGPRPNASQWRADFRKGLWQWYCFGDCHRGGDVIELAKALTGLDNAHVRFWFAEKFGQRLVLGGPPGKEVQQVWATGEGGEVAIAKAREAPKPENKATPEDQLQIESPEAASKSNCNLAETVRALKPLRFRLNLDADVPYLRSRGLQPETIKRFGLGLCRKGLLKDYVAIPVYLWPRQPDDNAVAYLGRWPGEDYDERVGRPRYKWPEGFRKSEVVYGLNEALDGSGDDQPLIVVEGPFKVFHLFQVGFRNTVAVFGAFISSEQGAILAATKRPVLLLFDGDEAGKHGMKKAVETLVGRAFVRVIEVATDVQVDELGPSELRQLVSF